MSTDNRKKIVIVGGGTAGYIAALVLKVRFPGINITIIKSEQIGIVGVGEGSTEHWNEFMKFINVSNIDIIKHCNATYKGGIMYKNWTDKDYLHSVQEPYAGVLDGYSCYYSKLICDEADSIEFSKKSWWSNRHDISCLEQLNKPIAYQYHFDTYKLNNFLNEIAIKKDIEIIEDEIKDVILNENGEIKKLIGNKKEYVYNFYVDCTGFKRLLITKLGAKWRSFSKHLKMKAAITFNTEKDENYNLWTATTALDYGWMFTIPTQEKNGNGYVFDKDYISADDAKLEVEKLLGKEIKINKSFTFDPGMLDRVWIKNCVAIGLSSSFIEPLEATSIGTSIQQSFLLMHRLINYQQNVIDSYNNSVTSIVEQIQEYVALHYVTKKNNSIFWKDMQNIELPNGLNDKLKYWQHKLPIREDFSNGSTLRMFNVANYILVLQGLGLFNKESIIKEYYSLPLKTKEKVAKDLNLLKTIEQNLNTITHKQLIETIKNS